MTVKLHLDWSGIVYSRVGRSDLFLITGYVTSNFLYLSFSTLRSRSLWRTDTTIFAKLNNSPPPPSHQMRIYGNSVETKMLDCRILCCYYWPVYPAFLHVHLRYVLLRFCRSYICNLFVNSSLNISHLIPLKIACSWRSDRGDSTKRPLYFFLAL